MTMLLIRDFHKLNKGERFDLIRALVPWKCLQLFDIIPETFCDSEGRLRLRLLYRNQARIVGVRITDPEAPLDPIFSVFFQDYEEDGVEVLGLNINDPHAPRFEVDLDEYGRIPADLVSERRNKAEEIRAMGAGLAPG